MSNKNYKKSEVNFLEEKYNVEISFRNFRGSIFYSVWNPSLKNSLSGRINGNIIDSIDRIERTCKQTCIDTKIELTSRISMYEKMAIDI